MKQVVQRAYVLAITLFLAIPSSVGAFGNKTFLGIRSQGVDAARELAGWQQEINQCYEDWYNTLSIAFSYTRSFDSNAISCFLFNSSQWIFSGSLSRKERGPRDILADYFGLPSDFQSTVCVDPVITNFIVDLDWYVGLDPLICGSFIRVHFPIVHSKWDLNCSECITDPGTTTTSYPAGYLGPVDIEKSELVSSVMLAFRGNRTFGDMREPMKYGKIFGRQTIDRLADLQVAIGWNAICCPSYHAGVSIRATAPTGNQSFAEFLFEPIAGNNHHWELGAGFTSHYTFYESECGVWGLYVDANAGHLFAAKEKRSYDFVSTSTVECNGLGSRYMLLEQINAPSSGLHVGLSPDDVPAENQYQRRLIHAINETTLDTIIRIPVQAEVVAKCSYQRNDWEFDIGYDFWYRSAEEIVCRNRFPSDCWAFKGDAQIYGFTNPDELPVPLSATQRNASIYHGQGDTNFVVGQEYRNNNADNPIAASDNTGVALFQLTAADAATFGFTQNSVQTSNPGVLLSDADINECSGILPRGLSHKIFGYIGKSWDLDCCPSAYLGIGFMAEWADLDPINNSAFSQWGIWLRGGLSY